ncbi:MAG: alanine racemase [Helicobacteraceae bacterium 4484_230]|nr:MAG: alanine racemase [Helicobacteraceae bacterium 4484_230]
MAFIRLSRSAFFHNLDIIAHRAGSIDKIALVLKDSAYGHGLLEMAAMAKEYGVSRAVVRSDEEAQRLADYFPYILVLAEIPKTVSSRICYTVNSLETISRFPKGCRVELKVDTGMHRNGISMEELADAFGSAIRAGLKIEGVFTHFRSADALSSEWFWQYKFFDKVKKEAKVLALQYGLDELRFHSKNSAALFRSTSCDEAMVRIGIAAYGCLQMDRTLSQPALKPVLSLWAEKIMSRTLEPSQRVGYNGTYAALKTERVSTYDIGYADGLLRAASNSYVAPDGAALLGRISMDNTEFSSTDEKICIFQDANAYAKAAGTIGYEILVLLSSGIKREVVQ